MFHSHLPENNMPRDFNDILREEGSSAVRAQFDRAQKYQPNGAALHADRSPEAGPISEAQLLRIAREIQIRLLSWDQIRLGTAPPFLVRGLIPLWTRHRLWASEMRQNLLGF
jgi:hypothetical protein